MRGVCSSECLAQRGGGAKYGRPLKEKSLGVIDSGSGVTAALHAIQHHQTQTGSRFRDGLQHRGIPGSGAGLKKEIVDVVITCCRSVFPLAIR